MGEYIKKEAVINFIENGLNNPDKTKSFGHDAIEIMAEVRYMPVADVVEVVRCKDCLYATERYGHLTCINGISYCNHWNSPDDFCNHGVRRYGDTK